MGSREVASLFFVLCLLPVPTRGRLVSPGRRQDQPEHLRSASQPLTQRFWCSGTGSSWQDLAKKTFFGFRQSLDSHRPEHRQAAWPQPCTGNKGIITTVSGFPFSITFCSLVFPSDVPELCCYNEIKSSSLVTVATFQVLNSLMPVDTILDRTNTELVHHHRKFCFSVTNLDFQENLESRNFYSFWGRIKKGRNALTKYLVYTSLPLILPMCGRRG